MLAVCTYRRPQGLLKLLDLLSVLEGHERAILLVIDNDPDRGAEKVVRDFNARSAVGALYLHAAPQGIATARNVALDFGGERGLAVLFIDDDEVPDQGWLVSMLSAHGRFPSAIIAGPVRPEFAAALPKWAPDGHFWRRPEYSDGESLRVPVGSGNALFPEKLTVGGLRFDTEFDLTGGEDTHLTLRWLRDNEQIVWSAQAVVFERVPAERLSLHYARQRAYSDSLSYQHVLRKLDKPAPTKTVARLVRRWVLAVLCWSRGVVTSSPPMLAKAKLHAAAARGIWAGTRGRRFNRWIGYQVDV